MMLVLWYTLPPLQPLTWRASGVEVQSLHGLPPGGRGQGGSGGGVLWNGGQNRLTARLAFRGSSLVSPHHMNPQRPEEVGFTWRKERFKALMSW